MLVSFIVWVRLIDGYQEVDWSNYKANQSLWVDILANRMFASQLHLNFQQTKYLSIDYDSN